MYVLCCLPAQMQIGERESAFATQSLVVVGWSRCGNFAVKSTLVIWSCVTDGGGEGVE